MKKNSKEFRGEKWKELTFRKLQYIKNGSNRKIYIS